MLDNITNTGLTNKEDKIYADCLEKAKQSSLLFKCGCIATYGGKRIASGCNTYKNYSRDMFLENTCTCHAEINVLRKMYHNIKKRRKLNKIMKKTTLYVSRYSSSVVSNSSAPCVDCLKMIKKMNIKKIVFNLNENYHVMNAKNYYSEHKTMGRQSLDRVESCNRYAKQ